MPAFIVPGSNIPATTVLGPLHVPPASGVPPSCAKSDDAGAVLHTVSPPFVPASGGGATNTETVAVASGHGTAPATV